MQWPHRVTVDTAYLITISLTKTSDSPVKILQLSMIPSIVSQGLAQVEKLSFIRHY